MSAPAGTYRIGKRFRFEATRRLEGGRWDGHSFTAEVVLSAHTLGAEGFVIDFGELAPLKRYIDATFDHRTLNDVTEDVSNDGLSQHLADRASANLPLEAATALEAIYVSTGRPVPAAVSASSGFEASHQLHGLYDGHPCGRLHGHSYQVSMPTSALLRPADVPVLLRQHIRSAFDGRLLNEVLPGVNPTSENLARYFVEWLEDRCLGSGTATRVRVSETESSWAEYTGRPA
ncbi:hypothetical protein T261_0739 [Streptomyces lydicus]|nr:hypothetical protein T261_0739 [Streptomyces lydicus]